MMLFLEFAFSPAILAFSFLMLLVVLYWLIFVLGILDLDFLDIDLDLDSDVDVQGEIDADALPDAGSALTSLLGFFYVGQVPVMILFSLLATSMWVMAMTGNYYINPSGGLLLGLLIGLGVFVASLFVVKIAGYPFALMFRAVDSGKSAKKKILGELCRVITATVSDEMGQVEMVNEKTQVILNAITKNGEELKLGDEAVVFDKDIERNVYIIVPVELEN